MKLDEVLCNRARGLRQDVRLAASGKLVNHVPTGFTAIDRTFGGLRVGCATELMAHTGDGKSAFARQVCEATAKAGASVLWLCGEDPEDATAERFLADGTGITATEMGRLDVTEEELERIERAAELAKGWASRIDVRFGASDVDEAISTIEGSEARLVVLDYLQIFGGAGNLEADIAKLATFVNGRAGERRIAALLLSQVRTEVLHRGREKYHSSNRDISGFIPGLGDTEWCRRAEKSTKAVWALVRPGRWRREMGEDAEDNYAELHVRKQNFGPMGWESLGWDGPGCRFLNK